MDNLKWCFKQNKGIKLVAPNLEIAKLYLKDAKRDSGLIDPKEPKWNIIKEYHVCYNALYSLLVKCGIKCEIHDCSLELMKLFEFDINEIEYIKELKEDIEKLGVVLGREKKARLVVEDIDRRLKKVSKNIRSIRPKVFIALSNDPLVTVSSFTGDLIELAGGENIARDMTEDKGIFNIEALIDRDPDIIIESGFREDMYLPGIVHAVKNKRIYKDLPADILLRPGPRAIDAVELLNRIFYENKSQ